jgi:predicted acyl esterase
MGILVTTGERSGPRTGEISSPGHGVRLLPGHRIRIEIASNWFSRFDRNPQTDAANWMTDTRPPVVAHQKIFHDREHPAHVLLPLIPVAPLRR